MSSILGPRRRHLPTTSSTNGVPPGTKEINAARSLENVRPGIDPDAGFTVSRAIGVAGAMLHAMLPALLSWGFTMGLIFGGCCSNVFALEAIVKEEPDIGLLVTFTQFALTTLFTWPAHFSASHPPFFLKPRAVPIARWVPNIILFFSVNLLNNLAFSYNISVPVHIILRSGGSITTMLVGFLWGRRYTRMQVFSVALLTVGIIIAAMADSRSKDKRSSTSLNVEPSFIIGLFILAFAQILSAIMGLYTQITYATYGSHWHENLFYSHFLSLPLFLPFFPSLLTKFYHLLSSPPVIFFPADHYLSILSIKTVLLAQPTPSQPRKHLSTQLTSLWSTPSLPKHLITLAINALTQYACIRGVNLLGARTSALGVTVVLNVRKLVSLFASIWLFGNHLPLGVLVGAAVVFGSAGIWAWDGQRQSRIYNKT